MIGVPRLLTRALALAAIAFAGAPASAAATADAIDWAPYFSAIATPDAAPDGDGFLHRWLILEPIARPIRSNQNFTSSFVRATVAGAALPGSARHDAVPADGATVSLADGALRWHALDAVPFDVKLFNVAQALHRPTYGVVFWVTTVVVADRDIPAAHFALGSNSASMWWLNGAPVADLFGDRRMVQDDIVSPAVTLHKGRNVLRGAIINGPGLSDFCARFVDDAGRPITDLRIALR